MQKKRSSQSKKFMTLAEVQAYLGIKSRKTLLKYIRSGHLPAFKLGGTRWRFLKTDIESFVQESQNTSNATMLIREGLIR